ncbi:hypothetical protein [Streptomyces sp. SAI-127]|uniref:hypothetical protein n=1 Tax=Streptomyces sp. SAI-127 TaxID=2940543 RepID=UPI0024735E75|nr:hypothetical protein [Streptomyces sp. SAI-127]MDH6489616.1 hypothetical protein [Streptomyces sp. SAI-127]
MLSNLDVLILGLLGCLFINPRRFKTVWRALLAAFACGIVTAAVYLLVARPLLARMAEALG